MVFVVGIYPKTRFLRILRNPDLAEFFVDSGKINFIKTVAKDNKDRKLYMSLHTYTRTHSDRTFIL